MASVLRGHAPPSAATAGRAVDLYPSTHVSHLRQAVTHHRHRTPAFGSARPQRVLVQAQAQSVSDAVAAPVAEVVKRLQGKVYVAGGPCAAMLISDCDVAVSAHQLQLAGCVHCRRLGAAGLSHRQRAAAERRLGRGRCRTVGPWTMYASLHKALSNTAPCSCPLPQVCQRTIRRTMHWISHYSSS